MVRDWEIVLGEGPVVATAIHAGHRVVPEVEALMALDPPTRLREEDPFTDLWTSIAPTRIVVRTSRFEVDMNRPADRAVYLDPSQAWGLTVWRDPPPPRVLKAALEKRESFYSDVSAAIERLCLSHPLVVVLDLHSFCHRRGGPDAPPEPLPDIVVGTGSLDPARHHLAARLIGALSASFDVGENVKFSGGHFPRWINRTFAGRACAIAIEVKKIFMDEWTGTPLPARLDEVGDALASAARGLEEELARP